MSERQQSIADALREAGANMSQTDKQAAEAIVQLGRMLSRSQQPQPHEPVITVKDIIAIRQVLDRYFPPQPQPHVVSIDDEIAHYDHPEE